MENKWFLTTFSKAPFQIIDGDRGKNYPKQDELFPAGSCLFLNAGNVTEFGFDFSNCAFITNEKDDSLGKGKLQRYDIVMTTRGTVGNVAYYDDSVPYKNIRINSGMVIFRPQTDKIFPRFLFLFLRSQGFKQQVSALITGSAQPQLPIRDINQIKIVIPPLKDQQAIAHILGTLDDKIELNRRMSQTLEQMARALFKAWFVDFEPVRAKCRGDLDSRPRWRRGESLPGLPAHLYDLFPDRLVDSELGEIPEGWELKPLGKVLELAYGKALKDEDRRPGSVPVFGSNGQVGWHDERLATGPGIIVGRKGNPGTVTWAPSDFFAIDTTFYVVSKEDCTSLYFLFYALITHDLPSLAADSAVPGLNRNFVYSNLQLLPPAPVVEAFDRQVKVLFDKRHQNDLESRTLAGLRDALLPKLISGQMRIRDAERFLKGRGL